MEMGWITMWYMLTLPGWMTVLSGQIKLSKRADVQQVCKYVSRVDCWQGCGRLTKLSHYAVFRGRFSK